MIKGEKIWLNGSLTDWEEVKVHIVSETFSYGVGVFEGIRCYETDSGPAVFRLKEHVARLLNSARLLYLQIPFTAAELETAIIEAVRANGFKSCYIRPMVYVSTYGESTWDFRTAKVDVAVAVWDWGAYIDEDKQAKGMRVKTSSYSRHHPNVHMTKAKANANYLNFTLARGEALRAGFDEALLLDVNGWVAEGPVENVFMVRGGRVITPPLANILEGITRDTVLTLAREEGLECSEEFFSRDYLCTADEAFFCGTAAEIAPIGEVDHLAIGQACPGPVTNRIKELFFEAALGRSKRHRDWLTAV